VDEERNAIAEGRLAVLNPSLTRELETRAGRRRQVQKDFGLQSIDNRRAFSRYAMQEMLKAASKRALSTPLPASSRIKTEPAGFWSNWAPQKITCKPVYHGKQ